MIKVITNQSFAGAGGREVYPDLEYRCMVEVRNSAADHWKSLDEVNNALYKAAQALDGVEKPHLFGVEYIYDSKNNVYHRVYGNVYARKE